ncbi:MAG TPA: winged helix-turn-helix domain-containing protein [Streptosporangiaceae bacterium]|nr:winged helix-turn-helix domain-containing protein [Streptosporangiaceae bacterium]
MTRSDSLHEAWLTEEQAVDHESLIPQFVQLAAIMRAKIIAWGLPAGTLGPAEAQLAQKYGVSRATARQAYRLLEELGYTDSREGGGHLVARAYKTTTLTPMLNSTITARPATPDERAELCLVPGTPMIEVKEPGKDPAAYDATRTTVEFVAS